MGVFLSGQSLLIPPKYVDGLKNRKKITRTERFIAPMRFRKRKEKRKSGS